MDVLIGMLRRPDGLVGVVSRRAQPFAPPSPEDLDAGLDRCDPYLEALVPLSAAPRSAAEQARSLQTAWDALASVSALQRGVLVNVIQLLWGTVLLAARERYYLFLWRTEDGGWSLPTPTAGFAHERPDGLIQATYRHSYHQGLVPRELYEETQAAIFRARHGEPAPAALVARLADELLAKPPDGLPDDPTDEANLFFRQHAALETVFHLGWGEVPPERALALLEPFLQSDVWHVQVSAVRALERVPGREARTRMMRFLRARGRSGFAQVMAVWALRRANARGLREELQRLAGEASDEEVGFGGSIMDPRVGTRFPRSVKDALEELVAEWAEEGR